MSVTLLKKEKPATEPIADGGDLIETMITAHGGGDFLEKYDTAFISGHIGGWIYIRTPLRTQARIFKPGPVIALRTNMEIGLNSPYVSVNPYLGKDQTGLFTGNELSLLDSQGVKTESRIVDRKEIPKNYFWDKLDLLYFFGYTLSYYFRTPYIFKNEDFQTFELPPVFEYEGEFRRLLVKHPAGYDTHSSEITYYIGKDGLIHHMRYNLNISKGNHRFVHFLSDYRETAGYKFPRRRVMFLESEPFINVRRKLRMPMAANQSYIHKLELRSK